MIKVMIVDDHALVRTGIRHIIDSDPSMEVITEASTGEEALAEARKSVPDVVMMDIHMPGIGGLEATRKLMRTHPTLKVIVLTVHGSKPYPAQVLRIGAAGFLTKGSPAEEMLGAIRQVHGGSRYVSPAVAQELALSMLDGTEESPFERLSQREMQVLLMIAQGMTIQDVSVRLCLSPKTISTYRYRLHDKLDVDNDVEMTRLAMQHGLIDQSVAS